MIAGLALLLAAAAATTARATILDHVPAPLDAKARYVIYLHGRIVEEQGRRPTSPEWGIFEYDRILGALAGEGAVVISEQRPRNTDPDTFAAHVVEQVRQIIRAGVQPEHVTVVGFSKGGGIATRTSALLKNPRVNFVFLAACGDGDFTGSDLAVSGRILSIYETSDDNGRSCADLFAKPGVTGEHSEMSIAIGGGHGAFFRPHPEWVTPLLRWVALSHAGR